MWTIADDMIREANALELPASASSGDQADRIHRELRARFGKAGRDWPIWEGHDDAPSVQGDRAWRLMKDFLGDTPCMIVWEPRTERKVVRYGRGGDLVRVLEECHRTEFYVTDDDMTYMFCFNHHDFLIGFGRAAEWLRKHRSINEDQ